MVLDKMNGPQYFCAAVIKMMDKKLPTGNLFFSCLLPCQTTRAWRTYRQSHHEHH